MQRGVKWFWHVQVGQKYHHHFLSVLQYFHLGPNEEEYLVCCVQLENDEKGEVQDHY